MSNTIFNAVSQQVTLSGYDGRSVVDRPIFHKQLGSYFKGLRVQRRLSLRGLAMTARRQGLQAISYQKLNRAERGQLKDFDRPFLVDMATFYKKPYAEIAAVVIEETLGLRPSGFVSSTSQTDADVAQQSSDLQSSPLQSDARSDQDVPSGIEPSGADSSVQFAAEVADVLKQFRDATAIATALGDSLRLIVEGRRFPPALKGIPARRGKPNRSRGRGKPRG